MLGTIPLARVPSVVVGSQVPYTLEHDREHEACDTHSTDRLIPFTGKTFEALPQNNDCPAFPDSHQLGYCWPLADRTTVGGPTLGAMPRAERRAETSGDEPILSQGTPSSCPIID